MLILKFTFLFLFLSIASANLFFDEPLLTGATSFAVTIITLTSAKQSPCYVTSGDVSACRRKRGVEEKPHIIQHITPSVVSMVETTRAPPVSRPRFDAETVLSSFDDSYSNTMNIFRQLAAKGRNNLITIGNCGQKTVNFSQLLSCLGVTVQETTTLTATFTETFTLTSGYTTMTVAGCTPLGFPYQSCPVISDTFYGYLNSTNFPAPITEFSTEFPNIYPNSTDYPPFFNYSTYPTTTYTSFDFSSFYSTSYYPTTTNLIYNDTFSTTNYNDPRLPVLGDDPSTTSNLSLDDSSNISPATVTSDSVISPTLLPLQN